MNIELKVGVKILLKNKWGKFLLIRRNLEKYLEIKGEWDIVGGRIKEGTSLFENLKKRSKGGNKFKFNRMAEINCCSRYFKNSG